MFSLYEKEFRPEKAEDTNKFISHVLKLGENYLKFLISINKIYLPFDMNPKDAAIDLLAEILIIKNGVFLKFYDFFKNNFDDNSPITEDNFSNYLRGFVYTVIQKNLTNLFKDNDPILFHIYRNIKETIKNLGYITSIHFSDKYLHRAKDANFQLNALSTDELIKLICDCNLRQYINNTPAFMSLLFDEIEKHNDLCHAIRFNDMAEAVKKIMISEYFDRERNNSEDNNLPDSLNIKFLIEESKFAFLEKLEKYAVKNSLSQNFHQCMYSIIEDITTDIMTGSTRDSVKELMLRHFGTDDMNLFYKVQYCVSIFEEELIKRIKLEKILIDRQ